MVVNPELEGEHQVGNSLSALVRRRDISLLTRDKMVVENHVCSAHGGLSILAFLEVS
jgi:hypothetical protein